MIRNKNLVYGGDIMVPATLNLGQYLLDKMWGFRNNVCFINATNDAKLTYKDIVQQTINVAVSLVHVGVRKGQAVCVFSENRDEFFPAALGAICSGAVLTTANVGYTKDELKHVLNISKPRVIFCSPTTFQTHGRLLKTLPHIKKIILFGDEKNNATVPYNSLAFPNNASNELFRDNALTRDISYEEFAAVDVEGDDTAMILYSSGTTGLPKGVMLSHLNVLTALCSPQAYDPTKITLTITPWYHVMGLVGNLTAFVSGRTAVYLAKFNLDLYLKTIEKYQVVQLTVVPPILVVLCKTDIKYDMSTVRIIYSGAAPLHSDTAQALKIKFPNAVVMQGYGMTEATLAVTRDLPEFARISKPGCVGRVVPSTTIKVADLESGEPLGPNKAGEICAKGPLIMKGYVNQDPKVWRDEEGYLRTGDIGFYDEEGMFFIVDRLKELIKFKGYQVPPAEIEALLLQHPAVKDVGVVAKPDEAAGEVPLAFVVRQPGAEVSEDELKAFVAEKLSNPKHLRGGVRFLEEIPKSPSGKILRKDLKAMLKKTKSKL